MNCELLPKVPASGEESNFTDDPDIEVIVLKQYEPVSMLMIITSCPEVKAPNFPALMFEKVQVS